MNSLKTLCELYGMTLDELVSFHNENVIKGNEKEMTPKSEHSIFESEIFGFMMIAIVVCSSLIAPLGVVISIIFLIFCRKVKNKYLKTAIAVVCIIALILSGYNCAQVLKAIFYEGYGTVEYLG